MDPRKTPLTCYHCGNTGLLTLISHFDAADIVIVDVDRYGRVVEDDYLGTKTYFFYKCPVCEKPVLAQQYESVWEPPDTRNIISLVYPSLNIDFENAPQNIAQAYEAAVRTRGIDNAICLLSLRRALEMVCNDHNAAGDNLKMKIDNLIEAKTLPKMLEDFCWIVRQCGNDAAHAEDVEFSKREVDEAIEYVGSIITYLYSTPVKVADLRRRIEKRQARQKEQKQEQNNVDGEENNG